MARWWRCGLGTSAGSLSVEYAIVLPLLLTFVLGLTDAGRLLWTRTTLARSVAAASRCAEINTTTCGTVSAIQTYAASSSGALGLPTTDFTVTSTTCGMQVQGRVTFYFVTPWYYIAAPFGAGNSITLSSTSCYPA